MWHILPSLLDPVTATIRASLSEDGRDSLRWRIALGESRSALIVLTAYSPYIESEDQSALWYSNLLRITSMAQRTKLTVGAHALRYSGSVGSLTMKPPNAMKKKSATGNRATAVSCSLVADASSYHNTGHKGKASNQMDVSVSPLSFSHGVMILPT